MFEQYCYRETRPKKNWSGALVFTNFGHEFPETNNHVSMYCVSPDTAQNIIKSYSVRGHRGFEHFSTELILDLDRADELEQVKSGCLSMNLNFSIFHTGFRGYHVHIQRQAVPSKFLYMQDKLLAIHAFPETTIDSAIYSPLHLIRAIGCVHEKSKTQKRKEKIFEHKGVNNLSVAQIPVSLLMKQAEFNFTPNEDTTTFTQLNMALANTRINLRNGQGRNKEAFILTIKLARMSISQQLIWEIISIWNNSLAEPLDGSELNTVYKSALSQAGASD